MSFVEVANVLHVSDLGLIVEYGVRSFRPVVM